MTNVYEWARDFKQESAERYMVRINEQVASVIIDKINVKIWLDQIIADDLANRIASFKESKEKMIADWETEMAEMLTEPTLEFSNVTDKLTYAFQALMTRWYTFTHDILSNWLVVIKFFKIEDEFRFQLNAKYSVWIKEITK